MKMHLSLFNFIRMIISDDTTLKRKQDLFCADRFDTWSDVI